MVYAEASNLEIDFSGIKLVLNEAYESWLSEQVHWTEEKLRLYVPLVRKVKEVRYEEQYGSRMRFDSV